MALDHTSGDSAELEALFEAAAVASAVKSKKSLVTKKVKATTVKSAASAEELLARVGLLTRELYESLKELGCEKTLQQAAAEMPETHDRLNYVAQMTKNAAERVLTATEAARPLQEELADQSALLESRWHAMCKGSLSIEEFKALVDDTRGFLKKGCQHAKDTSTHLHEIMMAQDFQDLTGQVIKRVIDVVHSMETNLVRLLLDAAPPDIRKAHERSLKNGPVVKDSGRGEAANNQQQVDDLLESLGF
jgi:chemotaxis protein CheZ